VAKAIDLVTHIYQDTASFPREEMFGLTSQIRRAAVSVPSNIAEGQGRLTSGEFCQFLGHARGSLYEAETQLEIAARLEYLPRLHVQRLLERSEEVSRMLNGLLSSLNSKLET
jgi:four helix bundle protein